MRITAQKLLTYLEKNDTIEIFKLHQDYHDSLTQNARKEAYARFSDDCKRYQKIKSRHSIPAIDSFIIERGYLDFPELEIRILNKEDQTLQLKSFKIIVRFAPLKYGIAGKIFNYGFEEERSTPKETKIIEAPFLIVN